jgi:DNA-binding MarR family transcriptional regulator
VNHTATNQSNDAPLFSPASSLRVAVLRIYRALRLHTQHQITPSQASALARIEQEQPLRLGTLAQLEGISPASTSKIVDSLEVDGFVARIPDPLDGRASMVILSEGGVEMIGAIRAASTQALERALSSLSAAEVSVLDNSLPVLEKIADALLVPAPH